MLVLRFLSVIAAIGLAGTHSFGQNFVETGHKRLPDQEFFKAVTCGVPPDQECRENALHWPAERASGLAIRLHVQDAAPCRVKQIKAALRAAISQLNGISPSLRLAMTADHDATANIEVYASALQAGGTILGTASDLDGTAIEGAAVIIDYNDNRQITRAVIVLAEDIAPFELHSIVLEELTQALGPIHDIRNRAYEGVSIFSEDSNAQLELGPQDVMVLRRLYP